MGTSREANLCSCPPNFRWYRSHSFFLGTIEAQEVEQAAKKRLRATSKGNKSAESSRVRP